MYGKMQESGFIEIIPLICTLAIKDQYPVFSILNSLKVHWGGGFAVAHDLMAATSFVY